MLSNLVVSHLTQCWIRQVKRADLASRTLGKHAASTRLTACSNLGEAIVGSGYQLDAAVGGEAAIDGNHDAGNELRRRRKQPENRSKQILGLAEARHGRMPDDQFAARSQAACLLIRKQEAILICQE